MKWPQKAFEAWKFIFNRIQIIFLETSNTFSDWRKVLSIRAQKLLTPLIKDRA